MRRLRRLGCFGRTDLNVLPAPPGLHGLELCSWFSGPVDVRPLRKTQLHLRLDEHDTYVGVEDLGPDVEIDWRN